MTDDEFTVKVDIHQGFILRLLLFTMVLEALSTLGIITVYADDLVLADGSVEGVLDSMEGVLKEFQEVEERYGVKGLKS